MGSIALKQSQYKEAAARFNAALSLDDEVGDEAGQAICIQSLNIVAIVDSK